MKNFFTLIAVAVLAFAAQANELTVGEGLSYSNVNPICGLYADTEGCLTQTVYPATMLTDMAGNEITAVTFYTLNWYYETYGGYTSSDETDFINFDGAKFQLALMEIDENGFTEAVAFVGATAVATCVPEFGDTEVTFVLDQPFAYTGKSLVVEVTCIETEGDWGQTYFFGSAADDNCSYYYIPGGGQDGADAIGTSVHMPMATFTYQEAVQPQYTAIAPKVTIATNDADVVVEGIIEGSAADYGTVTLFTVDEEGVRHEVENPESFTREAEDYVVTVIAVATYVNGEVVESEPVAVTVSKKQENPTSIDEMNAGKTVANVRYFNMAGQEMTQANGMTIVVTTYTDGTTNAVKVMK